MKLVDSETFLETVNYLYRYQRRFQMDDLVITQIQASSRDLECCASLGKVTIYCSRLRLRLNVTILMNRLQH